MTFLATSGLTVVPRDVVLLCGVKICLTSRCSQRPQPSRILLAQAARPLWAWLSIKR
jgi:hypothetical protein